MDEYSIKSSVEQEQAAGRSKYQAAKIIEGQYDLKWEQAYYQVRKYWNPPTQHSKKVRREMKAARVSVDA